MLNISVDVEKKLPNITMSLHTGSIEYLKVQLLDYVDLAKFDRSKPVLYSSRYVEQVITTVSKDYSIRIWHVSGCLLAVVGGPFTHK